MLSSKATNQPLKKGFCFNAPQIRPIRVMGMEWTGALLAGLEGIPKIAIMSWWTTKRADATKLRGRENACCEFCVRKWGTLLTYAFDRGYASGPWLEVETFRVTFVIRWIKKHIFFDQAGNEKKVWEIGRGKRYLAHKQMRTTSGLKIACDLWWTPVRHPRERSTLSDQSTRQRAHLVSGHQWNE